MQKLLESHPDWPAVEQIYHTLQAHGYKAFLAGGCVRDALLGGVANDLDVVTDATPDEVEGLFEKTLNVGKSFGVLRVLIGEADIEVATFRTDGNYKDGRRPEGVHFSSPQEDAQRRDFTVNALFYDLKSHQVLDFVHGQEDLRHRVLRTVGDPHKRFQEDHLRLLRAARFVSQLGFSLEQASFVALKQMAPLVKSVSGERIRDEMVKLLKGQDVQRGLQVMESGLLMEQLFPFRIKNNSWYGDYGGREPWQLLSLFFREAPWGDLKSLLKSLRLSGKEEKNIIKACQLWVDPEAFFKKTPGQQMLELPEAGTFWALMVLKREGSFWGAEIDRLLQLWHSWEDCLPKPLLSGEDLKGLLMGKKLGAFLAEVYVRQIERNIQSREEALQWLQDYLKRDHNE